MALAPTLLPDLEERTESRAKPRVAPRWKVILHNDDVNSVEHVVVSILRLTPLDEKEAIERTLEAHLTGQSVLLVTNRERAELYVEQFASLSLTVTCEPD